MTVLVAYATYAGSTAGVARRIADRLGWAGLDVELSPVDDVRAPLSSYAGIVVGSAIHGQAWLPEASRFMAAHADELAARPTWLFSVGMPGALARRLRGWALQEGPKVLQPFTHVHARGSRLFSGVVLPEQLPLTGRVVFRLMGGHYGDHREWAAIDTWADEIAAALVPEREPSSAQPSSAHPSSVR